MRFDGSGGRTTFLDELERWKVKVGLNNENWKEQAGEFLEDVTWEPVDGQHILQACQEIAPVEVGQAGGVSEEVFASQFVRHLAYTVVYDDPVFYVHESLRLNVYHFGCRKFATVGETMRKMRELWEHYGKPIRTNEDGQRRVASLACLPSILSITSSQAGGGQRKKHCCGIQDRLPHVQKNGWKILRLCWPCALTTTQAGHNILPPMSCVGKCAKYQETCPKRYDNIMVEAIERVGTCGLSTAMHKGIDAQG